MMLSIFGRNDSPEHKVTGRSVISVGHSNRPVPRASRDTDDVPYAAARRRSTIEHLEQLGFEKIELLSGGDQLGPYKIPKSHEHAVAAIATGKSSALILVDPEHADSVRATITNLRTRLASSGYLIEPEEQGCTIGVIKSLVDDYQSRLSVRGKSDTSAASEGRALWELISDSSIRAGASDFHATCENERGTVLIRVDGELESLPGPSRGVFTATQLRAAISWAYTNNVESGSNTESQFQDDVNASAMIKGRVVDGKKIAMRYQSFRSPTGPKVVCRLLHTDNDAPSKSFAELGYAPAHIQLFEEVPNGPPLINILAGITGSGKTTTAQSFWESHPGNGTQAFYSIEDPIELRLKGVHQINHQRNLQDREASEREFNGLVMDLLRGDLDAAFVGEIRDRSSGAAAQEIVFTGHMAMGTLHAQFISGIVPRLTDEYIGLKRSVLTVPNVLGLLSYQALVPVLCDRCKIPAHDQFEISYAHRFGDATCDEMSIHRRIYTDLAILDKRFGIPVSNFYLRRQEGCPECKGRGIKGQTVVAEMMIPDEKWLELTREGRDLEASRHFRSFSDGRFDTEDMNGKTVFEHALFKAFQGQIDPRYVSRFGSFARFAILGR